MTRKIAGVTDEAVRDATGRGWEDWFAVLEDHGGEEPSHGELVTALANAGVESGWWQQQLAVGYERSRGGREVGETADGDFQIGVQRTLPVPRGRLWAFLTESEGRGLWLGDAPDLAVEPGETYETADGTVGEIRTVSAGERVRLTWQPPDWAGPSTLQVTLSTPEGGDDRTTLRFHQEGLASGDVREAMRDHWREACDRIESAVTGDGGGGEGAD